MVLCSMYGNMYFANVCTHAHLYVSTLRCVNVCMHAFMHACMYICMCACMCLACKCSYFLLPCFQLHLFQHGCVASIGRVQGSKFKGSSRVSPRVRKPRACIQDTGPYPSTPGPKPPKTQTQGARKPRTPNPGPKASVLLLCVFRAASKLQGAQ